MRFHLSIILGLRIDEPRPLQTSCRYSPTPFKGSLPSGWEQLPMELMYKERDIQDSPYCVPSPPPPLPLAPPFPLLLLLLIQDRYLSNICLKNENEVELS